MKRFLSFIVLIAILTSPLQGVANNASLVSNEDSSAYNTVLNLIDAENSNDWDTYISLWSQDWHDELTAYFTMPLNEFNIEGVRGVQSASLSTIIELSEQQVIDECRNNIDINDYSEVKAFFIGVDYLVTSESEYYYNGINFSIVFLARINGDWKIVLAPEPEYELLYEFATSGRAIPGIEEAMQIRLDRRKGIIRVSNGQINENLSAQSHEIQAASIEEDWQHKKCECYKADYIRVLITATNEIVRVPIKSYVCNVLPNEWISSWNSASLCVGIVAIMEFVIHKALYTKKYHEYGYDIRDNSDSQNYKPGTSTPSCEAAWTTANMYHFETGSGLIWEVQYGPGKYDSSGKSGGYIPQWGTKYLGDQEYTWSEILHYYLDYSGEKGSDDAIQIKKFNFIVD